MKISVNEQTQRFHLALNTGWKPVIGHQIRVGEYQFCIIPLSKSLNISEVTSGTKLFDVPITIEIMLQTSSKEGSMELFYKLGESLQRIIGKTKNFDEKLQTMRKMAFERLGDTPPVEDYDSDWVFDECDGAIH